MSLYNTKTWKEFSKGVIELDGHKCTHCGRTDKETVLQVHHKKYIQGCKPWEYATQDCETVCRSCHSSIHGITMPKFGWEFFGDEDLEDLVGTCENCGSSIRYVFTIHHKDWGTLEVGTICCDNLTDSKIASNLMESNIKYVGRRRRFLTSVRWTETDGIHEIKQGNFLVKVIEKETKFYLNIHNHQSKTAYESLVDAKTKVFDVIESGELVQYFKKKNIAIEEPKKKRQRKE
jgi:hypothetical protein